MNRTFSMVDAVIFQSVLIFMNLLSLALFMTVAWLIYLLHKKKSPVQVVDGGWPVEMRKSQIHGRGMFATRPIYEGTIIEVAPLLVFNRTDVIPTSILNRYTIFKEGDKNAVMFGYASLYNHSDDNNAVWHFNDDNCIVISANRDIDVGEEVFVSYGANYWKYRPDKKVTGTSEDEEVPVP